MTKTLHNIDVTERLAIIGIGNLRFGLPVIGAIANFFGERPLEVACYDADYERLELFERFARAAFAFNRAPHWVTATMDAEEAIAEAARVILCPDAHCARLVVHAKREDESDELILPACQVLLESFVGQGELLVISEAQLKLKKGLYYRVPTPIALEDEDRLALPHQMLRWIKGDDMLYEFLASHEHSPIKRWLEHPESAELVPDA